MAEKEKELNLYQKIVEVRKSIGKITKDSTAGKGSKFSYDYVSGSLILSKIKEQMNEQKLLFVPLIKDKNYQKVETTNRYNKVETNYIVELDLAYKWINADNPEETLEIPFYAVGEQSDPSKAFGTALTYSERYVLLKMFNLPTDEDDADAKPQQQQSQQQPKQRPKQQQQDKGKLILAQQNAKDFAEILTANDQKMSTNDVLDVYIKTYKLNNIEQATNEQLDKMTESIKGKIEKYK